MNQAEPALRLRLNRVLRQISAQHRHLKPIFEVLGGAIARGDTAGACSAFDSYREAIDAHFSLEEEFFFPALHGLRPDSARDLDVLIREHARFLSQVAEIGKLLRGAQLDRGGEALDVFAAALGAHERREEAVVAAIRPVDDS